MSRTDPAKGAADFLRRVVPWPKAGAQGVINAHWTIPDKPNGGMPGKPFADLASLISFIPWANNHPKWMKDLYFCLSLQGETGLTKTGKIKAARHANAALALKALWLDVDGYKDYPSKTDALAAIYKFVKDEGLPLPTALVDSGGGWHIYWISDQPLTLAEWQPYADGLWALVQKHGLKADSVTTDAARVLRLPTTYNKKQQVPRRVEIKLLAPTDIDFAATLGWLKGIAPPRVITRSLPHGNSPVILNPELFKGGPAAEIRAAIPQQDDRLGDGIEQPLSLKAICKCPHYAEALKTGGKAHNQGLWMQTVLGATWIENPRAVAHALSDKHPGYSVEECDAMFDRKVKDREAKGLGWPSCNAFLNDGCTLCATCKHFGKIKSPLHLGLPTAAPALESVVGQVKEGKINPVAALMTLRDQGADIKQLLAAMNQTFAAVKYGGQIVIANIIGNEIEFMKTDDFHKMFANLVVYKEVNDGQQGAPKKHAIKVSRRWFDWKGRRQYPGRGVVFEPGGPLEIPNDMLNLWRGFGIIAKPGDWSLMRAHILNVVCSEQQKHFDYLLHWMAYAVQHLDKPMGVAVAFLGAQGAGKGIVARTFGEFFGKHFTHIVNGDQLTGRFNASLGASCAVFLDEALWAGDRKGEGVLKALITEPSFQLEAKFRDPIMVENRLRIIVASNNDWAVPTGVGDRRWFVLNVTDTYAGTGHRDYWSALYAEKDNGGTAAMLHDLLAMDLGGFDVRAVPHTAAKAQQQVLSLNGTGSWLHHILQEGKIGYERWNANGLTISKDDAYMRYEEFSRGQHDWRPEIKAVWSKNIRTMLAACVGDTRQQTNFGRVRSFQFTSLADCRRQFASHIGAPDLEWEPDNEPDPAPGATAGLAAEDVGEPTEPDALHDAPSLEWEPELEPDPDYWPEYEPEDEREID